MGGGRVNDLIIVGDEAWTPEEWEAEQARRAKIRPRTPAQIERRRETQRQWREKNREHYRQYGREWMRAKRRREAA
jgi:hypothetical protein